MKKDSDDELLINKELRKEKIVLIVKQHSADSEEITHQAKWNSDLRPIREFTHNS